jgi:hypothetical protein
MTLIIQKPTGAKLVLAKDFSFDSDAAAYIAAVEAADTQALETATRYAINDFVIGCKQDGIWSAIKASCILAGARTLNGALVPLVGAVPTNVNFVSGDYNRKTGLVGNGSTKYLNSNRNNNADPQNSKHLSVFATSVGTQLDQAYIGNELSGGASHLSISGVDLQQLGLRNNSTSGNVFLTTNSNAIGLMGHSRLGSTVVNTRANGISGTVNLTTQTPLNQGLTVFARNGNTIANYTNARLAFYSIGESLNLALLDARVTDLINAFAAAIP